MFGIVRAVRHLNKLQSLTRFCSASAGSGDTNEITIQLAKNIVKLTSLKNPAKNFQLKEFQAELSTLINNYEDLNELFKTNHLSFIGGGTVPFIHPLLKKTAPLIAEKMKSEGVDAAFLFPV